MIQFFTSAFGTLKFTPWKILTSFAIFIPCTGFSFESSCQKQKDKKSNSKARDHSRIRLCSKCACANLMYFVPINMNTYLMNDIITLKNRSEAWMSVSARPYAEL